MTGAHPGGPALSAGAGPVDGGGDEPEGSGFDGLGDDQPELLTLQEAADRLRVHYMTAYRWVRRGDLPAFKTGGRLRVSASDLETFVVSREIDPVRSRETQRTDWPTHVDRLHAHLREGEIVPAVRLVRKIIADGAPVGDVYVLLLAPALWRIGDDWERGDISVAEEHRATEIVRTILQRQGPAFRRRGRSRGAAVTVTAPDDLHGLGAAMVADFLRAGGYDVSHLGASLPTAELAAFLDQEPAALVCVSVTTPGLDPEAYAEIAEAARRANNQVVVVFGGQQADPEAARAADALHHDDPRTLSDRLARSDEA